MAGSSANGAGEVKVICGTAPKARNMKARGKREAKRARRPWIIPIICDAALKGRHKYFGLSGLDASLIIVPRGDVLRFASHLPLALIFRAFGAEVRKEKS